MLLSLRQMLAWCAANRGDRATDFLPGCPPPPPLQQAERCNAARLVLVAPDEWERGCVRVKDLASRQESDVPLEEL